MGLRHLAQRRRGLRAPRLGEPGRMQRRDRRLRGDAGAAVLRGDHSDSGRAPAVGRIHAGGSRGCGGAGHGGQHALHRPALPRLPAGHHRQEQRLRDRGPVPARLHQHHLQPRAGGVDALAHEGGLCLRAGGDRRPRRRPRRRLGHGHGRQRRRGRLRRRQRRRPHGQAAGQAGHGCRRHLQGGREDPEVQGEHARALVRGLGRRPAGSELPRGHAARVHRLRRDRRHAGLGLQLRAGEPRPHPRLRRVEPARLRALPGRRAGGQHDLPARPVACDGRGPARLRAHAAQRGEVHRGLRRADAQRVSGRRGPHRRPGRHRRRQRLRRPGAHHRLHGRRDRAAARARPLRRRDRPPEGRPDDL